MERARTAERHQCVVARIAPALGDDLAAFQELLRSYGYGIEVTGEYDEITRKVTDAFQRHFRPALVNGIADLSALRTAERLVAPPAA